MRTPSSRRTAAAWRIDGWNDRREQERDARPRPGMRSTTVRSGCRGHAERLEHVRAAAPARHRSVAVLGHRHAAGGHDDGGDRRDVEGAGAVAARAAQVERRRRTAFDSCTARSRIVRAKPTISAGRSPFIARPTSNPAMRRRRSRAPSMMSAIAAAASAAREVLAPRQLLEQRLEHVSLTRARKLRRSWRPGPVRTDSGWNCTPWIGHSRWRSAMTMPSSARPGARPRGRRATRLGDTTSEW